jgi:hypothetical protein
VLINQNGLYKTATNATNCINLQLLRDSTNLGIFGQGESYTGTAVENAVASSSYCYLDSPATTSSVTYKTQLSSRNNTFYVAVQLFSSISTITLMEIAG